MQVDAHLAPGAGDGERHRLPGSQHHPAERGLDDRVVDGAADQSPREGGSAAIEGPGPRDTEVRPPRSPEVLQGRQGAGVEHLDHPATSNRTRVPGASSAGGLASGVPEGRVGPADQEPAAGRRGRVDAAPAVGERDGPGLDPRPRAGQPRDRQLVGQAAEVGEAGREPAEEGGEARGRVAGHDLVGRAAPVVGHPLEVRPVVGHPHRTVGRESLSDSRGQCGSAAATAAGSVPSKSTVVAAGTMSSAGIPSVRAQAASEAAATGVPHLDQARALADGEDPHDAHCSPAGRAPWRASGHTGGAK